MRTPLATTQSVPGIAPIGALAPYSGSGDPAPSALASGVWVIADGRLIDKAVYAAFFGLTGHAYNAGVDPGGGKVKIPDKRGKSSRGAINMGTGAGANDNSHSQAAVGASAGEVNHALSAAENAPHTHSFNSGDYVASQSGGFFRRQFDGTTFFTPSNWSGTNINATDSSGSGTAHNNLDPYEADSYIVRIA